MEQSPREERAQAQRKRWAGATDSAVEQSLEVEGMLRKRLEGSSVKGRHGRERVQHSQRQEGNEPGETHTESSEDVGE